MAYTIDNEVNNVTITCDTSAYKEALNSIEKQQHKKKRKDNNITLNLFLVIPLSND